FSLSSAALTDKDTIVLADFSNSTGDEVFDDALKQGLATKLEQSPFLSILTDRRVRDTLKLMGRQPDERLTGEVATEIALRTGSKAVIAGSISNLGSQYVIGLSALNCQTGDSLARQQVYAEKKEDVLSALDQAATRLREQIGESLASIQKYDTPIAEATTSSLEALKSFSLGRKTVFAKGDRAGIPYFQQTVDLDPNFALAYASLAVAYSNLGQATQAIENARKAYDLRDRVSEREKYRISAFYHRYGTGELDKANQVYEQWKQSYPRDFFPPINLGDIYMTLGQWEKASQETQDSISLEPNTWVSYYNLAAIQLALNRPEEARATVEQAMERNLDTYYLRIALYQEAFLRGDQDAMQQQLAWAAGRSGEEDWLLSVQSDTEAYSGRLTKARGFSQRAIDSAKRANAKEAAALWQANAALREAEFGNASPARQGALSALALSSGRDVSILAALALARAGDTAGARKIADALNKDFPHNTIVQGYWLPSIRAAMEINAKNYGQAVDLLNGAEPYELGQCQPIPLGMIYPAYLRGQAYLLARQGREAAAGFQKILDYRGVVINYPLGSLARLGLARSYTVQGDIAKARSAYEGFLALWKDADAEIPNLKQARAEYAQLN
ncbi:MAG TPA: tetratricopeptide repeat protein, partial [Blastocatellia bacterium]|nr:tetratricopeptide repeat protein [Blastocatellia bacterium]